MISIKYLAQGTNLNERSQPLSFTLETQSAHVPFVISPQSDRECIDPLCIFVHRLFYQHFPTFTLSVIAGYAIECPLNDHMDKGAHKSRPSALSDPKALYYKDQRVFALQTGSTVWKPATIRDIQPRSTSIRPNAQLDGSQFMYYVHYHDQNCRMDEWVDSGRIRPKDGHSMQLQPPDAALLMSPQMTTRQRQAFQGKTHRAKTEPVPQNTAKRPKSKISAVDRLTSELCEVQADKLIAPPATDTGRSSAQPQRVPFDRRPKNISKVHFGMWSLEPWYYSPFWCLLDPERAHRAVQLEKAFLQIFPVSEQIKAKTPMEALASCVDALSEHAEIPIPTKKLASSTKLPELFVCEFCLESFPTRMELNLCHPVVCTVNHPPGREIYADSHGVSIFEVDAVQQRYYCERLCLLSRLFLEHKCVDFDIQPFAFYIATFRDANGCHLLGYFSKEKSPVENNNLSCIMVLPPYQSNGVGKFLIDLCYEIAKREGRIGTPERPLSDLGARSYHSYWRDRILDYVLLMGANGEMEVSFDSIMQETGIALKDIVETLMQNGIVEKGAWDYSRGKLSQSCTGLAIPEELRREHFQRKEQKEIRRKANCKKGTGSLTLADLEKVSFLQFNRFLLDWDASMYFLAPSK